MYPKKSSDNIHQASNENEAHSAHSIQPFIQNQNQNQSQNQDFVNGLSRWGSQSRNQFSADQNQTEPTGCHLYASASSCRANFARLESRFASHDSRLRTLEASASNFVKGSAQIHASSKEVDSENLHTLCTKELELAMDADRLNSPSTSAIRLEVLGHQLHFAQDPNSKHLGTTVWDASVVFVKFLEKNCRKGRFCPTKLKGKRVLELGAGCGVAGFGMALLGCDVISTDQIEVLPLLMRNIQRNTSRVIQTNPDLASFGSIQVMELDWGNQDHIKAVDPPFDYVIGTDVVYAEHLLEPLLKTILSLSGPKTTILLGYEIRSTTVHEQMLHLWKTNFDVKTIPKAKMDSKYQHASIQLFMMGLKPGPGSLENMALRYDGNSSEVRIEATDANEEVGESSSEVEEVEDIGTTAVNEDNQSLVVLKNGKLSDWEARRYGSMAARLLQDVKIT